MKWLLVIVFFTTPVRNHEIVPDGDRAGVAYTPYASEDECRRAAERVPSIVDADNATTIATCIPESAFDEQRR